MSQKSAKSAAELESMIMAELREHPECESAGVVVSSKDIGWDAVLVREGAQLNDECGVVPSELRPNLLEIDLDGATATPGTLWAWARIPMRGACLLLRP
jgi:hypothetical protein